MKSEIFYITIDKFNEITKYLGRPEIAEEIKENWVSEVDYIINPGLVKIKKVNPNKIEISLEKCTQEINDGIKKCLEK